MFYKYISNPFFKRSTYGTSTDTVSVKNGNEQNVVRVTTSINFSYCGKTIFGIGLVCLVLDRQSGTEG